MLVYKAHRNEATNNQSPPKENVSYNPMSIGQTNWQPTWSNAGMPVLVFVSISTDKTKKTIIIIITL